eukprot:1474166-Pyramimonas_sp.AAC.1
MRAGTLREGGPTTEAQGVLVLFQAWSSAAQRADKGLHRAKERLIREAEGPHRRQHASFGGLANVFLTGHVWHYGGTAQNISGPGTERVRLGCDMRYWRYNSTASTLSGDSQ